MYRGNITIAEENRVRGFDPLRFLEMTANGLHRRWISSSL